MMGDHDILLLQTTPSIAAIYYHTYLSKTHALYCPDDGNNLDDITVRRLGRQIVEKFDSSNDKKLAVHFMKPCPVRKLQDVLQFIEKIRKELTIDSRVLATTPIQNKLLAGWAMSLDPDFDQRKVWLRRCLVPYYLDAFNNTVENKNNVMITEYLEPFCIADRPFEKQALIINVTRSICSNKSGVGFVLDQGVEAAIHGWADVVKQLPLPGTVILIADEKKLYKGIPEEQGEMQDKQLQRHRDRTYRYLEQLGSECPVYLYMHDYTSLQSESIADKIACIQHRHSLCIGGSFMISWSREESGLERDLPLKYFSNLRQCYIREILVQKSRIIWKNDFLEILRRKSEKLEPDSLRRISPSLIDVELAGKEKSWIPLLYKASNELTIEESFQATIRHSVSAFNIQIFQSWKSQMENIWGKYNKASSVPEPQSTSPPPQSLSLQHDDVEVEQPASLPLLDEDSIMNLRDRFADRMDHDNISNYIENKNAFSRGGSILGTLDQMEFSGDTESIDIWAKAKGTAKEPYEVTITLVANPSNNEIEYKDGWCSCPVGKYGKCKHCTALLLRFMLNADEFDFKNSRSQRPIPPTITNHTKSKLPETGNSSQNLSSSSPPPLPQKPIRSIDSDPIAVVPDNEENQIDDILPLPINRSPSLEDIPTEPPLEEEPTPKPKNPMRVLPWNNPSTAEKEKTTKKRGKKTNISTTAKVKTTSRKRKTSKDDKDEGQDEAILADAEVPKKTRTKKLTATSKDVREQQKKEKDIKEEEEDQMFIDPTKLGARKRNHRRATTTKTKKYIENDEDDLLGLPRSASLLESKLSTPSIKDLYSEIYDDDEEDDDPMKIDPTTTQRNITKRSKSKSPTESFNGNDNYHDTYRMAEGLDNIALNTKKSKYTHPSSHSTDYTTAHESNSYDHLHHQKRLLPDQHIPTNDNDGSDSDVTDDGLGTVYRKNQANVDDSKEGEGSLMSLDLSLGTHSKDASDIEMTHSLDDKKSVRDEDMLLSLGGAPAMTTDDLFDELGL